MAMTKGCPQSGEDLRSGGYAGDKDGREGDWRGVAFETRIHQDGHDLCEDFRMVGNRHRADDDGRDQGRRGEKRCTRPASRTAYSSTRASMAATIGKRSRLSCLMRETVLLRTLAQV